MNPKAVKVSKALLGGTAVLSVASLVSGQAIVGAGLLSLANVSNMVTNVAISMTAANLGEFAKRLGTGKNVLENEDLAKAAGDAIAETIRTVAREKYPDLREVLTSWANCASDYWVELARTEALISEFSPLQEAQLRHIFATNAEEFANYQVLEEEQWRSLVSWLLSRHQEHLPEDVSEYTDVVKDVAKELDEKFAKHLREVLKDDAENGGQAFAGMLLDLLGESLSILQTISDRTEEISGKLDEMPTRQDWERNYRLLLELRRELQQQRERQPATETELLRGADGQILPKLGDVSTVPNLPRGYILRETDLASLKQKILGDVSQKLVVTSAARKVGLQGMGGIGKTVLAVAVCRDDDVRRRFPDGIIWLTVGQTLNITARQVDICQFVERSPQYFEDPQQGKTYLKQLLADKACLLVLDDVWNVEKARWFDVLGERGQLLITTRDGGIVSALGADCHQVDRLEEPQALALLAQWANQHPETLPDTAREVAAECGHLALALALSGAKVGDGCTWEDVLAALRARDLQFLDHPHGSILKSLTYSIDTLDPDEEQPYYLALGAFPADTPIPEAAVLTLWRREDYRGRDLLATLARKALLFRNDGQVSLHDVQQDYLSGALPPGSHDALLAAYQKKYPEKWHEADDGYFLQNAVYHFREAGRMAEFARLLWDFRWLQAKLLAMDTIALLADFGAVLASAEVRGQEMEAALRKVEGAIRLSAHVLAEDKAQLGSQLWGRLAMLPPPTEEREDIEKYRYFWERLPVAKRFLPHYPREGKLNRRVQVATPQPDPVRELLQQIDTEHPRPWLRLQSPTLTPPGGPLIRTFTGHSRWVNAVAVTPAGQLVSGSSDNTVKLWDMEMGNCLATFIADAAILCCAISPDGETVVAGDAGGHIHKLKIIN